MPWSTRELAERAGTTVNTIRHYHRIGLLEEPERRYNGYKQYGVRHLLCLLRIRRLVDLGVPLARIGEVGSTSEDARRILHEVDLELRSTIDRLQKARTDVAAILRENAPADIPAGFESLGPRMSEADRSMLHVYSQVYDESAMADIRRMAECDVDELSAELDRLPPDAPERVRRRLADRLVPGLAGYLVEYPWLSNQASHLITSEKVALQVIADAMAELYNPAQLDVLGRAKRLAEEQVNGTAVAVDEQVA